ncbi:MAG: YbaY family lipoprotein, partial [Roseiflexaceae bacterium]
GWFSNRTRSRRVSSSNAASSNAASSSAVPPAVVIAEQSFSANGAQAPFPFTLQYDKARITTTGVYIVQGNIKVNGQLRYTTSVAYRVITQGSPTNVAVTMDATGTLPNTAGGTALLLAALLLAALLLLTRLLRVRLLNQPSPLR